MTCTLKLCPAICHCKKKKSVGHAFNKTNLVLLKLAFVKFYDYEIYHDTTILGAINLFPAFEINEQSAYEQKSWST